MESKFDIQHPFNFKSFGVTCSLFPFGPTHRLQATNYRAMSEHAGCQNSRFVSG